MRWTLKPIPSQEKVAHLSNSLGVGELVARLLVQRGIETFEEARSFFRPSLDELHDPFLMKDMEKAVDRIVKAIEIEEKILIYGDYDVDGTTSVAMMSEFLRALTANTATYIPDRYTEGYGISYQGINFAHDNNITLIIALDCGIKAVDKVQYAKEKGIDFIICDHHLPGTIIPDAVAVLDPKRIDCDYPFKELCGCGVGFKLIQALGNRYGYGISDLIPFLDLVATAIGADIVSMTGENRILAYHGMKVINSNPRTGFKAILETVKKKKLTITDVVFIIAPRINAAGRMKHGNHAVALLTERNIDQARIFAEEIEMFNRERRRADQQITEEALLQIRENAEESRSTTVVYQETWHKGVLGIVASRLTETFYRPTLVFTKSGTSLSASARSVSGFDVYSAIEHCAEHIEQFGGHKFAAGLTLLEENFLKFKNAFEKVVSETIDRKLLSPEIEIDMKLDFKEITPKFYRILKQFAPFGPDNPLPVFLSENVHDTGASRKVGQDGKHLKLSLRQGFSNTYSGIGFNIGDKFLDFMRFSPLDIVYCLDENEWEGQVILQLRVKDICEHNRQFEELEDQKR